MNLPIIFIFIGIFGVLVYFLHMWLNRGKKQLKNLIPMIIYSIIVACVVFSASIANNKPDPRLYFPGFILLVAYPVYLMILDVFKGRQSPLAPLLFVPGLALAVITPFLPDFINIASSMLSILLFVVFFIYMHRYPHLNPMWLEEEMKSCAALAKKPCKYSAKPVVVFKDFNLRSCARIKGLLIIIKKDRAIIRIKKSLFTKLGSPNLQEFANNLLNIIMKKNQRGKK